MTAGAARLTPCTARAAPASHEHAADSAAASLRVL